MAEEMDRVEQRRLEREQRQQQRGQNPFSESKPKTNFSFDWRILIPVIVLVLAGIEVIVFSSIQPWNYLFAIIIFIASAYMFVQYFNKDKLQAEVFVPKKAYNAVMDEGEKQAVSGVVGKMDLFKGIEKSSTSSAGKDSFNLDDFLKSFPEESSSKPKKRFAEVIEDSSPQPERRVEDKLMQLAKQKEQEKKFSQQEPVRSFQKTETTETSTESKTVSFKDLKENTLKELKDLAKKKKKTEEEQ
ncbi:MAG: hypothetical protein Q7S21_01370 [archaeon]|nr:hypothetical protein [archaeon]